MPIAGSNLLIVRGVGGSATTTTPATISIVFGGAIPAGTRALSIRADGGVVDITGPDLLPANGSIQINNGDTFIVNVVDEKSSTWGVVPGAGATARLLAWR